jgi:hypothetical protein
MESSSIRFIFIALSVIFLGATFRSYLPAKKELTPCATDLTRIAFILLRSVAFSFTVYSPRLKVINDVARFMYRYSLCVNKRSSCFVMPKAHGLEVVIMSNISISIGL